MRSVEEPWLDHPGVRHTSGALKKPAHGPPSRKTAGFLVVFWGWSGLNINQPVPILNAKANKVVFGALRGSFPVIPPEVNDVLVRYVFGVFR